MENKAQDKNQGNKDRSLLTDRDEQMCDTQDGRAQEIQQVIHSQGTRSCLAKTHSPSYLSKGEWRPKE